MLRVSDYTRMLEKRASKHDGGATGPDYDYDIDNQEVANAEHESNLKDTRSELGKLFDKFPSSARSATSLVEKVLPGNKPRDVSAPLLKIAMATLASSERLTSLPQQMVAMRGFTDELEKIAGVGNWLKNTALGATMAGSLGGVADVALRPQNWTGGAIGRGAIESMHLPNVAPRAGMLSPGGAIGKRLPFASDHVAYHAANPLVK